SMFGFQRTGDGLYAAADQMARGFVLGATAGRTTLTGEGLQHADGHSLLLAATNPAAVAYDPAWSFEIAHIVKDGLRRMYGETGHDNLLYPGSEPRVPYVTEKLAGANGPVVAVSDWMRAVPDLIRPYVPTDMLSLGTDGFGFSDTRPAARRKFLVDAESITVG